MIRLQQMRLDSGLTVTQLAENAGVTRKTIHRLERTGLSGYPEPLHKLANYFDCQPSELLAPAVFPTPDTPEAA